MNRDLQKLKTVMDMLDDIIVITDGRELKYINEAFFRFSAYRDFDHFKKNHNCICELFIETEGEEYLKAVYPDGNWITHMEQTPKKEYFAVLSDKKGGKVPFRVKSKKFDAATGDHIVTLQDISTYVENAELLNLISNVQGVYFVVMNMMGEIIVVSHSLLEFFKVEHFKEKAYSIEDFLNEQDVQKVLQHIMHNDSSPYEITLRHAGITMPVLAQGNTGVYNNSLARIAILVDLSEIKKLQEETRQKDLLLFQQSKLAQMGEMVNMIAHQWRQPLNAISAASIKAEMKWQMGQLDDDEFHRTHRFIQNQCQEMSHIINLFLQYAQAEQKKEKFTLREALDTAFGLIEAQFKAHDIHIVVEDEYPFCIYGSKDLLSQVIVNLLINARDAYDEMKTATEKKITIKTVEGDKIEVIDHAGGIDEKYLQKLFTPYFTTKDQGKGSGLGLYMSKRIMREHFKGDLSYEKTGDGSRFILEIGERSAV